MRYLSSMRRAGKEPSRTSHPARAARILTVALLLAGQLAWLCCSAVNLPAQDGCQAEGCHPSEQWVLPPRPRQLGGAGAPIPAHLPRPTIAGARHGGPARLLGLCSTATWQLPCLCRQLSLLPKALQPRLYFAQACLQAPQLSLREWQWQ